MQCAAHRGFAGDIEQKEAGPWADVPFREACAPGVAVEVADGDRAAGTEHGLRDASADPLGAAGDEHHAVAQGERLVRCDRWRQHGRSAEQQGGLMVWCSG